MPNAWHERLAARVQGRVVEHAQVRHLPPSARIPLGIFSRVIRVLMKRGEPYDKEANGAGAMAKLTAILATEASTNRLGVMQDLEQRRQRVALAEPADALDVALHEAVHISVFSNARSLATAV